MPTATVSKKPTPAFGHPSKEGNHLHPLPGGVPRSGGVGSSCPK